MDSFFQKSSYRPLASCSVQFDVSKLNCCFLLQDQVELEVVQLKAVRIHVPATRLITGTEVRIVADTGNFCWPKVEGILILIGRSKP